MSKTPKSAIYAFILLLASFVTGASNANAQAVTLSNAPSSVGSSLAPFEVTATFLQDVFRFDAAVGFTLLPIDISIIPVTVTNGTGRVKSHSGRTFVLEITPASPGTGSIDIFLPRNAVIYSNFNGNPPSNVVRVATTDTVRPTVVLTAPFIGVNSRDRFSVTATFSESVSQLTFLGITVVNGLEARFPFSVDGDDRVWIFGIDAVRGLSGNNNTTIDITVHAEAVFDGAFNPNTVSNTLKIEYDTVRPAVSRFEGPSSTVLNKDTYTVQVYFTEGMSSFSAENLDVTNATVTISRLATDQFNLNITPTGGNISITIPENAARDGAGNGNTYSAGTNVYTRAYDNVRPAVSRIEGPSSIALNKDTFTVQVYFTKGIASFSAENIEATNATVTISRLATDQFNLNITPTGGDISIAILENAAMDPADNGNTYSAATNVYTRPYDNVRPAVSRFLNGPSVISNNDPFVVQVEFTKDVPDFSTATINATRASVAITRNGANNRLYNLVITPTGGNISITIPENAATDVAGNGNTYVAADNVYTVIYNAPPLLTGPTTYTGEDFDVILTFEVSPSGFSASRHTSVVNGSITRDTLRISGGVYIYTLTITPTGTGTITISIPAGVARTGDGVTNPASEPHIVTYVDIIKPTVVLSGPAFVNTLDVIQLVIEFSEAVFSLQSGTVANNQFIAAQYSVTNGTLIGVTRVSDTGYILHVTPVAPGSITVFVRADVTTDLADNRNPNTASNVHTVIYDPTPPTVELTGPETFNTGVAFDVTATFSKAVTGFDAVADITVTNGMAMAPVAVGSDKTTYTLTITSATGAGTSPIEIVIPVGAAMDNAGNSNTASEPLSVAYTADITVPTVVLSGYPDAVSGTAPFAVTATFSEPVTGFDAVADITVTNGTAAAPVAMGNSATTYTLTITPDDTGNIGISIPANVATDGGDNPNTASNALTVAYTVDITRPTVVLTGPPRVGINPFEMTATFSEKVLGFDKTKLTVFNGSATEVTGGPSIYTLTITPDLTGSPVTVTIPENVVMDSDGNLNMGNTLSMVFDGVRPFGTLLTNTVPLPLGPNTATFDVILFFRETVKNLQASGITVTNGRVSGLQRERQQYTITITPDGTDGNIVIELAENVATDAAGNGNQAARAVRVYYDATPPMLAALTGPAAVNTTEPFEMTAIFTEPVTGFALEDITVDNGSATEVTGGPRNYSVTIMPDGNGPIDVIIPAGTVSDLVSNPSITSTTVSMDTVRVAYDTTPPMLVSLTGPAAVNTTEPFEMTAIFTEDVIGFALEDITVDNGSATEVTGGPKNYSVTIMPDGNGPVGITIAADAVADAANNGNTISDTVTVTYDATAPTVMLTGAPTSVNSTATFEVTAMFSEIVTGLEAAEIDITNGTVTLAGSGTTYTLSITPTTDGTITITIPASVAADTASNGNTASDTVTVTYDGTAPTVMLTGAPTTVNSTATFEVTATFSEIVTGLEAAEIDITNATVTLAGSGTTYTLTITPGDTDGTITITIPASVAADDANNGNTISDTVTVTYDATAPTMMLTGAPTTVNSTATFEVTATFSETVTGLEAAEIDISDNATVTLAGSGTIYTLTITPAGTDGTITITIPADVATDTASNGNTASDTVTVTYDATAPTVMLTGAPTTVNSTATFEVTAMFSEVVTGLEEAEIDITNATVTLAGSGTTYTLTITPTTDGTITITIPASVATDTASNGNTASNEVSVTYDGTVPTVTLTGAPTTANASDTTFEVTATFSEVVTGLEEAEIDITNATVTLAGSGTTYTLTITPGDTDGTITITIPASVAADAANNGNTASDTVTVTYDATAPTVMLTGAPTTVNSTATFEVTATFSEVVTGLEEAEIDITNATVTLAGSGTTYTLTITPADTDGTITITIPASVATDTASNGNTASDTVSVTYDATAPTVMLTGAPATVNSTATFEVTAMFSEPVTGLEEAEIDISDNATVTLAGSGTIYTLTITPAGTDGTITIAIPADAATDTASNGNTISDTVTVTYDATATTVMLTGAPTTVNSTATFAVTATFSEGVTGLEAAEIDITNGSVTLAGSGTTYTLTITPAGTDGTITITIPASVAVDGASNGNTASNEVSVTYDGTAPTVTLSEYPTTANASDTTFAVTATFSEPVTGLEEAEIDISDNATVTLAGSGTTYTLTITPTTDGTITITIPASVATDTASNGNEASSEVSVTYDGTAPTVTLSEYPTTANASDTTFEVTATFSEVVTGLEAAEIDITNATVTLAGSGTTYTLTITPAGTDGTITITIPASVATDTASNGNTASSEVSVTYDATAPTVMLTGAPTTVNSTATFDVTATFDEAVTGFNAVADITVTNGAATVPVAVSNSETTYTLNITPDGSNLDIEIFIPADAAMDDADNPNTESNRLTVAYVDTTPPTVTLTGPDPATFSSADAFVVTATFSEAVTGFDAEADITVTNGAATVPVAVGNSGTTYTLNITPAGTDDIEIFIPAAAAMDEADNPNPNTESNRLTVAYVDATPPTVTLTGPDPATFSNTEAFVVTATFSEAVTGFDAEADITVTNGAATVPVAVGNSGTTYTLNITPAGTDDIEISIPAAAAMDGADNPNTASETLTVTYTDTTRPTATLSTLDVFNNLGLFALELRFSEVVTGTPSTTEIGTSAFIEVDNGTAQNITDFGGGLYLLGIQPTSISADVTVTILEGFAMDGSGNTNTASAPFTLSYIPPITATLMGPDVVNSEAFTVQVAFSEDVLGFEASDIRVTNGATAAPIPVGNSARDYTLTITPDGTGDIGIIILEDTINNNAIGGNSNAASAELTVRYDGTRPTVTLTGPDPATYSSTDAFVVTATFSEAVTGFDAVADITVTNGATTVPVAMSNSETIYTLTITPAGTDGTITITIPASVATDIASNGNTASNEVSVTYDATAPTVMLTGAPITVNSTATFEVTATFSESVTGLEAAEIDITNATVTLAGSGTTYTLTITPGDTDGTITITIPANVAANDANNGNTISDTVSVTYDTTAPTVMLTGAPTTANSTATFEVTATFSERVTGFDAVADITVTNGTAAVPARINNSTMLYTLTITPDGTGNIGIIIPAAAATDPASNPNMISNEVTVTYDATPPTVSLTADAASMTSPFTVTATFSESINPFSTDDIVVDNGQVTDLMAGTVMPDGTVVYMLTITPTAIGDVVITFRQNTVRDAAGNGNTASSTVRVAYDTTPPTVTFSEVPANHDGTSEFTVTVTLSEPADDFIAGDITFSDNATGTLTGSDTDYTLTVMPTDTSSVTINIATGSFTDAAGNPNTASEALTVTYTAPADNTPPTVTLTGPDPATFSSTEAFVVTATFSEAVTGFDAEADITVTGGTAAVPVAMDSSETIYTLTITPAGTDDIEIFIPAAAAMDATGNGNPMSNTVSVTYDDTPPVASVHIGTAGTQVGTIAEAGTTSTTVTVTLSAAAPPGEVTVLLTRSGSADIGAGNDYTAGGISGGGSAFRIIVAAGATTASFMLTAVDDSVDDDDETAVFTVTTGTGYTVAAGGAEAVTVTITDNDVPPDATPPGPVTGLAATPGNGQVALSWTNPSDTDLSTVIISATVTADGTVVDINGAGAGNDLNISATPGSMGSQTITGLVNGTGYTFSLVASDGTNSSTPATIASTPVVLLPEFSFPTTTATGPEGEFVNVDIAFTGGALASMVSLNVSLGGDAVAADYSTMNGSAIIGFASANPFIRIAEGRPSRVNFFIDPATDAAGSEGDETLIITLLDGEGYTVGSQNTYTLTITDVPPPPVASVHIGTAGTQVGTIAEAGTTSTTVTVALSAAAPPGEVTVLLTRSGSADIGAGNDYTAGGISGGGSAFRIIVAAGATTASFMLTAVDDSVDDDDETAVFTVTTGTGYTVAAGGAAAVTVTILDDSDTTPPTVTLSGAPSEVTSLAAFEVTATFDEDVTGFNAVADITVTNGAATVPVAVSNSETTYTLNITPAGTDDIEIFIPAAAAMDGADNPNTESNRVTVTYTAPADTTRPTATLSTLDVFNSLNSFLLELTFSEVVTGTPSTDIGTSAFIEVDNGTAQNIVDLGTSYLLTIQPTSISADVTVTILEGFAMDGSGNTNTASAPVTLSYIPPITATLMGPDVVNSAAFTVQVAFSEDVLGFVDTSDIGVTNGATAAPIPVSNSARDYTLTITPDGTGDIGIIILEDAISNSAGNTNAASAELTVRYDGTEPTVTLTSPDPATFSNTEAFVVTATFSEAVTGFDAVADITVTNGTAAAPTPVSNSETTYTLTITPAAGTGDIEISIPAAAAADAATNGNTASETLTVTYAAPADTTRPTVTLTGPDPATYSNTEAFVVTATFSEAVTGFDAVTDITVTNGTAAAPTPVSNSETIYTLTITPAAGTGDIEISIPADAAADAATNGNTASETLTVTYAAPADTTPPTVMLTGAPTTVNSVTTFAVTATFSEAVTGFDEAADITVTNGAATIAGSGTTYTLTITPDGTGNIGITIPAAAAADAATNGNAASNPVSVTYDATAPTVELTGAPTTVNSVTTFAVTATFSEAVTGFDEAADITVTNGAATIAGSGTTYTLTITPAGTDGTITITIPASVAADAASNGNTISDTVTVTYDATATTVRLTGAPTTVNSTATFAVTATFSENVTGLTAAEIDITNATVTLAGSGTTYTLTITPAGTDGEITIIIPAGVAENDANNPNTASNEVSVTYDATPPTVMFVDPPASHNGSQFTLTVRLSEPSTDFIERVTALLSGSAIITGSGMDYLLTFPTPGTVSNMISIFSNSFTDAAGNPNTPSGAVTVIYVDDTPPTVALTAPATANGVAATFAVTAEFSEDVTGFDTVATDIEVTNGTATIAGSGTTYTLTITPTVTDGEITINIPANAAMDGAGNANTASTDADDNTAPVSVRYDGSAPTVMFVDPPASHNGSQFTLTVRLSEPSTDFIEGVTAVLSGSAIITGSGMDYLLTFPTPGTVSNMISIFSNSFTDAAGNPNTPSGAVTVIYVDDTPPTVALTAPATANGVAATFAVTAEFSEDVTGFDTVATDIEVTNGTATIAGSGTTYTLTITPTVTDGEITINIPANAAMDGANNGNTASTDADDNTAPVSVRYDGSRPTVMFVDPPASHNGSQFTLTVRLSEPSTDFIERVTALLNGSAIITGSGMDYLLTFPTPSTFGNMISIRANSFTDAAGNPNTPSGAVTVTYEAPDTTPPTVTFSEVPTNHDGTSAFMVTVTLSEIADDFVVGDIAFSDNATGTLTGSGTDYTLTVTPTDTSSITIDIAADSFTDAATNPNTASETLTVTYTAPPDTTPPTVVLTSATTTFNHDGTSAFMVTVTLSEPSTDFVVGDISISANASGTLTGSGTDYTLTVTPTDTSSITIDIAAGTFTDAATNPNTASEPLTVTYAAPADTTPPTVMLTSATTTLGNRTPFTVTATFSEDVTGFDAVADITVINGIVGRPDDPPAPPVSVDGSARVYTLTITPNGNGNISISIPANAAMDGAGLGNTASAALIVTYTGMDTTGPSAVLTPDSSIGERSRRVYFRNSNAVFEVTVTFDEPVRGFGLDDIIIQGGTTSNFMGMDEDTVYTFDLTPGTGTLQVAVSTLNTGITDLLDNALITSTTLGVGYDATPPTVALSDYPATANGSTATFAVTATFSEAVPGFNAADITVTNGAVTVSGSGPIYTLTITPDGNDGTITIAIAASVVTDAAGNPNTASTNADSTTPSDPVSVTYDATPPTVMLASTTTTANNRDPFDVTATFSEPVTGFDAVADITVTNATVTLAGTGPIYTLTITPDGNDGEITIAIAAGVAEDAASNGNMASNTVSVAYDATAPTVMLTVPDPATFSNTEAFVVTATFSEAVTGFDEVADITVTNGAAAVPVAVGNSETTYTLTITPAAGTGDIEISIPVNAAADAATNGNTISETLTVTYTAPADNTPPTVTLTGPDPATFSSTDAFVVTATFSEAVTGFDAVTDIMVTNGATTVPVAVSNSETTYTLNITPDGSNLGIEIFIPAAAAMDEADNPNTVSNTLTVAYTDTTPPTVELTGAPTTANASDTTFAVTATFSEPVTGFDVAADITVTNGTVAAPEPVGDSGTTYTLTITPAGTDGEITITIPANAAVDASSNNNNMASNTVTVTYDGTPPTIALTGEGRTFNTLPFTAVSIAGTSLDINHASFTSDEWVTTPANVMVTSAPGMNGFRLGTVYSIMHDGTASQITITAPIGSFTDNAGNPNTEAFTFTFNYVDNTPPTVTFTDPPTNHSNSEFMVTVTLSEPSTDFVVGDISISANASGALTGSGTDYTLTVTPTDTNSVTIDIATGSFTDATGNMNTASETLTVTYAAPADTTPPTVTLTGPDPATYSNTEAFVVTATFSEAVTGFDAVADITVTNGTAAVPVATNAMTYTLTITPAAGTDDIEISIPADAAMDGADNPNTASETLTVTYAAPADNTPPTVTLTGPDPATYSSTEPFVVTATFSEAVTGFDAVTDITVTNGTAMAPVATNAMTYTLTITPAAGTGDIEISIPADVAMDEANNPNTESNTVTVAYVDTTPLTVTLATPAQTANDATAFNVTITFSEDVTGFVLDDIVFNNARALTALRMTNASTYVVPVQADNMADVTITVPAGVAMAGTKTNLASNTLMVPYDHAPTVVLTAAATSMTSPFTVTATFSESVSGFDVDDIMIDNGTVATVPAPVAMPDGTAAYTLTITPTAAGDVTLSIPAGGANDLDGQATANTASNALTVAYTLPDTTAPTVALTDYPDAVNGPFAVTATFSESVTGLEATEIDISTNATVTIAGSGTTYTLTITPTTDGTITITIPADVAENDANNGNTASSEVSVTYDGTPPTATFSGAPASHDGMTPFMVTVTLSEPSSNFVEDDTSPTNAERTLSGSGTDYILTITPLNNNPIGIGIFADRFTDAAGNGNAFTNATPIPYAAPADTTEPTVTFSEVPANHDGTSEFMVTVTLSEPATDFIAGDISISSNATGTLTGSGTDYTLTVTPTDNNAITIDIATGTFTDAATNGNTASETLTVAYAVPDTTPPTVARPVAQFSIVEQTTSFEVTVTFSEAVTGFDAATDIMVTRGTTLAPVAMGDSGTIYTLAITPAGPSGQIVITIPAGVAMDASGNLNTASPTLSVTYIRPVTVVLSLADPQFTSNGRDPFAVTATFSEPVNFIMGDVMVANGTFTASGNGAVYTLTITPTGDTNDAITIQLLEGAGEVGGSGQILPRDSDASEVLQVMVLLDNTPPTVELTGPATFSGETFAVTAEFSEVVTGLTADEITITGASVTISGEGTTYTLTIVPDGTNGDIEITIPADVARDDATNMNTVSNELTVRYDNTPLTVTFTDPPANHSNSEFMVTVTLSEPATGFVVGDIDFSANATGTLTGSGTVYTLTVTPTDTSSITIDIAAGSFTDAAGSPNTASDTLTVTYAAPADTTPPTVMLTGAPTTANSTATFEVTATFSEPVTGFDATDVDITHGDLIEITPVTALVSSSLARATLTRQLNASTTGHSFAQIYTLTIMPAGTGDITITINAGGVMDAAGNGNTASMNAAGNTAPVSVTYDAAPTVTLTGPDPATYSSTDAFVVTATFSENVTGFDAVTDITVTYGTAAAPVAVDNSETTYTLTITPDGSNGNIEITIPAGAAMDNADNPNTESEPLTVAYTASADTKAAITGFMLDRANKLASNQPGLARFLQGTDCGTFSANSTDASGSVDGCLSNGHTWGEISRTWSSDNTYTLATVGLHGLMRDDLIIGGLVQFDKADDDKRNITGQGWLVGPYFVRKPTDQNMTFEGRLLYGQTDNDISPLGSYTDSFDTERYLAQLRVTGEYGYRIATMMPSLDLTYTEDTQQAYKLLDEQGVDLTQLTFGMDFKLPVAVQTGQLDLTGGLSGTYSETNGGESDVEGGRGRTELGLNYSRGSGTTLRLGTFYDGISSDHESFGVNFSLDMKF